MKAGWGGLWAGAMLLLAGSSWAKCTSVATLPAAFGALNSTQVRGTSQSASSANSGLQCNGSVLSVLSNTDSFVIKITSTTSGLVGPTGDVIPYTLYADATTTYPIARGTPFEFRTTGILDLLGLLNGTPKAVPIYMRTQTGANVAAGLYQETLNVEWTWKYCDGIGLGGLCIGYDQGSDSKPMTVSLTVTNDCQITTPNISFSSAPVVSGFGTVSQGINVSCTKGSSYTVGLDDGQNVSGGRRRMKSSANNYLAYDIFKSAGTVRWGSSGAARRASADADVNPGAGTGTGSQVFNYNAKVYTDQATPPAATYSDSVILDVQF
ncbi:SCPU domain-containing protein [Pseudomonas monteilii]|uniref:Spore coat protein U domain-containing protein n=2 Tax=Pseudomonas TaxID=286 RepID=A0A6G6UWZ4_9PSED|nr:MULTISPECIES: spore coat U domain-containing protein [Pseudomonas]AVH39359.1 SCPU domain-containing protein [Pseudomonas monteilii]MBV4516926.1 spore coat U domain-containing protein [Pseudomonas kurunegalensis]MBZ3665421.1 spore coat protein U domain-containing protein [Pseudomonas monteilii]MBZ3670765.1 spore coat protein U domain-containing protein [Pseudomonas monteilii]MCA4077838.1 spore coat U domain-containing protein [Pseudomonas kurunegalensis]